MKEQNKRQYLLLGAIAIAALVGVGLIAFLAGSLLGGESAAVPTATAPPTDTPLPPPVVTIQGIRSQAKLSTVEQTTVTEIYNENVPDGWLDGLLGTKERLLMLTYGSVQAGFDLEKLDENQLWTDGKRVRLVLPAPEIISSSIDFKRTHIVYYENNLLLDDNNPNLQGEALAQAKDAIEQAALEAGILDQANDFGKLYFENFLYSLGFTEVEVVVDAQIFKE
jgi:Protein of unknown function (DUF4230)